jgi:hypothetical protein
MFRSPKHAESVTVFRSSSKPFRGGGTETRVKVPELTIGTGRGRSPLRQGKRLGGSSGAAMSA